MTDLHEMSDYLKLERELAALNEIATPGPWEWQNGCSWWRLGTRYGDGDVICPTVHHMDNHPDLSIRNPADKDLIIFANNNLPTIRRALRLAAAVQEAEKALEQCTDRFARIDAFQEKFGPIPNFGGCAYDAADDQARAALARIKEARDEK
jgi:hypothetical protein